MEIRKQSQEKEVRFLRSWTKSQMERYLQSSLPYPTIRVQTNGVISPQAQPVTRRPDANLEIEPLNTLICAASLGSSFISCTCRMCKMIRRASPTLRSVMARTGEEQEEYTNEDYDNIKHLVDQSYSPAMCQEQTPQEDKPGAKSSGSGGVGRGPHHQQPTSPKIVIIPKLASGVPLQTFISNLGVFGEKTRDTTTKYEARYAVMGPGKALEQLLSMPTNPQMLIQ